MATTPKKRSKKSKAKPRRPVVKTSVAEQAQTNAELRQQLAESLQRENATAIENVRLFKELQERNRDLTEALEQQTATGEVLRVIASSPTDLQPVLNTLIANAVKLSGATNRVMSVNSMTNFFGLSPIMARLLKKSPFFRADRDVLEVPFSTARAFSERKPIQIADAATERGPNSAAAQRGARTLLSVPLLREGMGIGVIVIWRDFVEPFTGQLRRTAWPEITMRCQKIQWQRSDLPVDQADPAARR